ncbi:MAG: prepilin-type N-terminal cleavage/methylation domain-containing protein [Elusimicrobiaceae bacterium]|nr:prepilin-type N-terminal cleavage/methylation domain-containing protein [Elusimicrobiaceae bacterium]
MFLSKKSGFTLMEMIIVIIIIAVLSAFAVPSYLLAVERMQMAEADMLMGNTSRSQERYKLRMGGRYARHWGQLDSAPPALYGPAGLGYTTYCSKDSEQPEDGNCVSKGFKIVLYSTEFGGRGEGVVAERVNSKNYGYKLARLYEDKDTVYCAAGDEHTENDQRACADFLGLDEYDPSGEEVIATIEALAEE